MSESLFSSRRIEQEKYAHIPYVFAFFLKKLDISVITVILKVHCFFFLNHVRNKMYKTCRGYLQTRENLCHIMK